LKGGMLIAAMVGLDTRSTMDMDTTLKGQALTENAVRAIFTEILQTPVDDDVSMTIKEIEDIHDEAEYRGLRVTIETVLDKTHQVLKVDITTGDSITPREINYQFKLLFEDKTIEVKAYNLETVLAEKLETILSRSTANTRMRDFYDVYILTTFQRDNINKEVLMEAFRKTVEKRGTNYLLENNIEQALDMIKSSTIMQELWMRYQKRFSYAEDITWDAVIKSICNISIPESTSNSIDQEATNGPFMSLT
jgi:predicted nucleotidyltransferase component of viral defense system